MNIELFFIKGLTSNQKKWLRHYYKLCKRGKTRNTPTCQTENHHILPKSLGGKKTPDNMVRLTCSEHFIAHQLLAKIFPKNYRLTSGAIIMSIGTKYTTERIHNKSYQWIRTLHTNALKGQTKEVDERAAKISKALTGRTKENDETKRIASEKLKGRTKENNEGYAKISKSVSKTLSMTWILTSPAGVKYTVENLPSFCRENNIPDSTIRKYGQRWKNKTIPVGKAKGWCVVDYYKET